VGRIEERFLNTTSTTTTRAFNDTELFQDGEEVYASWVGSQEKRPYYYCVDDVHATRTPELYGTHVYEGLLESTMRTGSTTRELATRQIQGSLSCRDRIRIDRKWQKVHWFDFFPKSNDLALLLFDEGVYVVEVDDRSWQNTQILYPGKNLSIRRDEDRIFIRDGDIFVEVFTTLRE
jgi:hypothetical protein